MKESKKILLFIITFLVTASVTGFFVFLTREDKSKNTFTIGDVKITLTEPHYHKDIKQEVKPNNEIVKDPTITNKSDSNIVVFMKVEIPKVELACGGLGELYSFDLNDGWFEMVDEITEDEDKITKVFYYDLQLSKNSEATLFNKLVVSDYTNELKSDSIEIFGYAIDSEMIPSGSNEVEIYKTMIKEKIS
jgi:flagellar basal body-associated protein FliL